MKETDKHDINILNSFVAGSVGGMCFLIVGYPFDTIKVRHYFLLVVTKRTFECSIF